MKCFFILIIAVCIWVVSLPCILSAQPFQIEGYVDVDNYYNLYTGDPTGNQLTYRGYGSGPWYTTNHPPIQYTLTTSDLCIYFAAWSDWGAIQGLLHNLRIDGVPAWFDDPRWEVYPTNTGYCCGYGGPMSIDELQAYIQVANQSNGWRALTLGEMNDGTFPNSCNGWLFNPSPNIDHAARWAWYDSGNGPGICDPWDGFDHGEYLIFRLCIELPVPTDGNTWGQIKALYKD
jgi:hypothetical protein